MSTKIVLRWPYYKDYIAGYVNTNKEPRRVVALVRRDGTKTSTSYARYIMSCHVRRYLRPEEHVDHIDENKMNDSISNLQILSRKENIVKHNKHIGKSKTMITLICPICKNEFSKDCKNINHKLSMGKTPTCSRRCGGKMSHLNKNLPK